MDCRQHRDHRDNRRGLGIEDIGDLADSINGLHQFLVTNHIMLIVTWSLYFINNSLSSTSRCSIRQKNNRRNRKYFTRNMGARRKYRFQSFLDDNCH